MSKLTLSVPEESIKIAKRYAAKEHKSVSALVTEIFNSFGAKLDARKKRKILHSPTPITNALLGCLTPAKHTDKSDRELLEEALAEKYLH